MLTALTGNPPGAPGGHLRRWRVAPPLAWAVALTLLLLLAQALPAANFFATPAHYLPLHTALEVLSITVSAMVFGLAWNLRDQAANPHRLVLGTAFLAVALIDLTHTLSYAGMPPLLTPSGPEKAINFWLAGRLVAAAALLLVALAPATRWSPVPALLGALALAGGVGWVGLWHADALPHTFIPGRGLTPLKVAIEYGLALAYAGAALALWRRGRRQGSDELQWLAAAAWVQGLAELYFTLYANVTDVFNLLGHLYKAGAYLLIYRGLFVAGVHQPRDELALERARLHALLSALPDPIWLKDDSGVYLACNPAFERLIGQHEAGLIGRRDADLMPAAQALAFRRRDEQAIAAGGPMVFEERLRSASDGQITVYETTKAPMRAADGRLIGVLGMAHDISPQRALQQALQDRILEANSLHRVFRHTEDLQMPLAAQLQQVADDLAAAWRQPGQIALRLVLAGQRVQAGAGRGAPAPTDAAWLNCPIPLAGDPDAAIAVWAPADDGEPTASPGEKRLLLQAVATRLASVAQQRDTQRRLREREAVFSAIVDQAEDSIALLAIDSERFVEFNDAAARHLGYSHDEFARLRVADIDLQHDAASRRQLAQTLQAQGSAVFETRHRHRDGHLLDVLVRLRVLPLAGQPCLAVIWTDITERKHVERQLRESEQHFRTLADGGSALIWTSGVDQAFDYFNQPWLRFTGRTLAQERGQGWLPGLHPDDEAATRGALVHALAQRAPFSLSFRLRRADGAYRWLRSDGSPRSDSEGRFIGHIGFCVDITEYTEAVTELNRYREHLESLVAERTQQLAGAKEAAEAATVAKSTFLANMSHEIRTPLNAILGMTYLLRRSHIDTQQASRLDRIDDAGQHLLATINAVLDLSKIDADQLTLEQLPLNPGQLVREAMAMLADKAQAKGLRLQVEGALPDLPLLGDATRLRQAMVNYLDNAVKFTAHGQIVVRLQVSADDAQHGLLRFEVRDSGVGVSPSALGQLFTAFQQADSATTRRFGGTGLGLALTRRLALAMGGDAGAESVEGQGSQFWFTARLRLAQPRDDSAAATRHSAEAGLLSRHAGRRVLVAEDEPVNREVIGQLLADVGQRVTFAGDGDEAVAALRAQAYDLVLMDMQMPRTDGLEATRQIRQLPQGRAVTIIALTANAFDSDRARCLAAGMDDFLTKPVDPGTLFAAVLQAYERLR